VVRPPVLHARVWVGGVLTTAPRTAAAQRCPSAARSSSSPGGRSCDGVVEEVLRQTDPDAVSAGRLRDGCDGAPWADAAASTQERGEPAHVRRSVGRIRWRSGLLRLRLFVVASTPPLLPLRRPSLSLSSSPAAIPFFFSATLHGSGEESTTTVLEDGGGGRMRRRRTELLPFPCF
jgi:hypothetical protein